MSEDGPSPDAAYSVVEPEDFAALLQPHRYGARSPVFDKLISATHAHYWNPLDPRYIDFDAPFDVNREPMIPEWMIGALQTPYVSGRLSDAGERTRFVNAFVHYAFSNILHGEQGAYSLSVSLCRLLADPGAQEYAANQAREEARHVTAFSRYIHSRWGPPLPCGPALRGLLTEIVSANDVGRKIVGMQILVEGLAMGIFAEYYNNLVDPVGRHLLQLVMSDEAFHHRFGKIWAERTIGTLTAAERAFVEDWAAECFRCLLLNLVSPSQQVGLYEQFGLDPERVLDEFQVMMTEEAWRADLKRSGNIFRVLAKSLLHAGIITERSRSLYATYVDLEELQAEGEANVGDKIAENGLRRLEEIRAAHPGAAVVQR